MFRSIYGIERWVKDYRERQERNLPVIPPLPPRSPDDRPGNKAIGVCGECGRTVYQIEMYSCSRDRCPIQLRITF